MKCGSPATSHYRATQKFATPARLFAAEFKRGCAAFSRRSGYSAVRFIADGAYVAAIAMYAALLFQH
jgi:hypothetical protein